MTYAYPANSNHDDCCTDPTCRTLGEWIGLIDADLETLGHHHVARQVRVAKTDRDLAAAADHLDVIAVAGGPEHYDRLQAHVRMLRRLAGAVGREPQWDREADK